MEAKEIANAIKAFPEILQRAKTVVEAVEGDTENCLYVEGIRCHGGYAEIAYLCEYTGGVPSARTETKKTIHVPFELLDPDWESRAIRKAIEDCSCGKREYNQPTTNQGVRQ